MYNLKQNKKSTSRVLETHEKLYIRTANCFLTEAQACIACTQVSAYFSVQPQYGTANSSPSEDVNLFQSFPTQSNNFLDIQHVSLYIFPTTMLHPPAF